MSRWFRFYDDVINDPKVLRLPEAVRWAWVAVLCIASKNEGTLPKMADTAFLLRTNLKKANSIVATLVDAGLLDKTDDSFSPHNWGGRQFLSDGSAERVRRHREKRAAAGLESQWFAPKALRKEVYARDNYECVYCGSPDNLSLDHKTPESRGGTHDVTNLQTACRKCNGEKRDFTHEEYVTRNGGVTLQKRPQTTETETQQIQKEKEDAAPAALPEADLFKRGKEILGKNGGGIIKNLLKAKQNNVPLARAAIEQASTKEDPREYIGAIIRGREESSGMRPGFGDDWG